MCARAKLEQTNVADWKLEIKMVGKSMEQEIDDLKELLWNTRESLKVALDELMKWEKQRGR